MASRAGPSAEAVTVQVLTPTMWAAAAVGAQTQPRSSNWRSRAAPSACVARQPNCSMKKVGISARRSGFAYKDSGVGRGRKDKEQRDRHFKRTCLYSLEAAPLQSFDCPWPINAKTRLRYTIPRFRL